MAEAGQEDEPHRLVPPRHDGEERRKQKEDGQVHSSEDDRRAQHQHGLQGEGQRQPADHGLCPQADDRARERKRDKAGHDGIDGQGCGRINVASVRAKFSETACARGILGTFNAMEVLPLMMANAMKFKKFGA